MHNFQLGSERRRIEDHITTLAAQIDFKQQDASWLDGEQFSDFIYAWHDLARYYERTGDTTVAAHLLKLYMRCAVMLRQTLQNPRLHITRRDRAQSALMELNCQVDAVIHQIERNTTRDGSSSPVGRLS